jgi:3',5'-cyclic-AMP phosphodiesterase
MPGPILLAQLSDPHIGGGWGPRDPVEALAAAVRAVGELDPRPAAVLVTGDLTEAGTDHQCEQARTLLEELPVSFHVLPGNHDDRAALRRHFDLPGAGAEPVLYAVDLGAARLVILDSTRPGEDRGELDDERLAWLDGVLGEAGRTPTILAMHHPPIVTGMPPMEAMGLPEADRRALAAVLARHPQVRRVVAGHMHRPFAGALDGRAVLAAPSTYVQLRLDFTATELEVTGEPVGFALHAVMGDDVASHVVTL